MVDEYIQALPPGTTLERYRIDDVLGHGGFGITYRAVDLESGFRVAIKEYLPPEIAVRSAEGLVRPRSSKDESDFQWGMDSFFDEATTLARFSHPNIIQVDRFFRSGGTGYIVMEFADGETLSRYLKRKGRLRGDDVVALLLPVIEGLRLVHSGGFLHRDIKPANIIIRPNGGTVLIDFGAARHAIGARSQSVTSIVTPGYAPIEQYSAKGNQGPWSDIYALAGVAYKCLTGDPPADATERIRNDPLIPLARAAYGRAHPDLLQALDWGLAFDEGQRPQSLDQWLPALVSNSDGTSVKAALSPQTSSQDVINEPTPSDQRSEKYVSKVVSMPKRARRVTIEEVEPPKFEPSPLTDEEKRQHSMAKRMLIGAGVLVLIVFGILAFEFINSMAAQRAHDQAWETASTVGTKDAYEKYLDEYPTGSFAREARRTLISLEDRAAWSRALNLNTSRSLQAYLDQFPNGRFAQTARERINALSVSAAAEQALVEQVQERLAGLGFDRVSPSGEMDLATNEAIKLFIAREGLGESTDVSMELIAALDLALETQDLVRSVQQELLRLGYGIGTSDGRLGPSTSAAIREFQELSGLTPDGSPSESVLVALKSASARPVQTIEPGDRFSDCPHCPEMRLIPAGEFRMGDLEAEGDSDELPVRTIRIPRDIAISLHEVTRKNWESCVNDGGCAELQTTGWAPPGQPAAPVTWFDAVRYVDWLSETTGKKYRLPSEAEWEYAARAGTNTRYAFGDSPSLICDFGNIADKLTATADAADVAECEDGFIGAAPVGLYDPNGFGLYDIHGNVWEWVQDCWSESYEGLPSRGQANESPTCERRVLRGGSWLNRPILVRVANRLSQAPDEVNERFGFRVVRDQ